MTHSPNPRACRTARARRISFDCASPSGHDGRCSPYTLRPNPIYHPCHRHYATQCPECRPLIGLEAS